MATPNIVPRADSEGGLGTASKYWASAYIDTITTTGTITYGSTITIKNSTSIKRDVENSYLGLYGGSDLTNDSYIRLHGNSTNYGSVFINYGYDTTNSELLFKVADNTKITFSGTGAITALSLNGIPFFTDTTNNSMYTHDVSGTDDTAQNNTAYGFNAMDSITTGDSNVAIGHRAGQAITGASQNTFLGKDAGYSLTVGNYNVAIGYEALYSILHALETAFQRALSASSWTG